MSRSTSHETYRVESAGKGPQSPGRRLLSLLTREKQESQVLPSRFFGHRPPRADHAIVAVGARPALIIAVGVKAKASGRHPVESLRWASRMEDHRAELRASCGPRWGP